jgi:energy-converting hydrogenase Eha subunit H
MESGDIKINFALLIILDGVSNVGLKANSCQRFALELHYSGYQLGAF